MTMWPSRMPRTASATGSLWSSPSTSTREQAGDGALPGAGPGPLQQPRQLGEHRRRIALGGRRLAGGQADLALRHGEAGDRIHQHQHVLAVVAEDIRRSPASDRRPGGASAPARRRSRPPPPSARGPPSPRSSCRNSCTSRPRSPISPITETSAATLRASIDSSTDLPTPEPAKMPMRWPRQQVMKVLSARTPRSSGAPTRRRACAGGGALRKRIGRRPRRQRALAVDRLAHGVDHAAEPARRRPHRRRRRRDTTARQPRRTPSSAPNGISSALAPEKPTTSQGIGVAAGLDHHPGADRHGMDRARRPRPSGRARRRRGHRFRRRRARAICSASAFMRSSWTVTLSWIDP